MRCARCGTIYRQTETWCLRRGKALNSGEGEPAGAAPGRARGAAGSVRYEQKMLNVLLNLQYVPFSASPMEHRNFAAAYQRAIEDHISREERDGWAVDGMASWQASLTAGRIQMGWWDRMQESLGITGRRTFISVNIPLKRRAPAAAPVTQPSATA